MESAAPPTPIPNGSALAALVSAGIGSFAVGLFVILHEAGLYSAPSLYRAAGGVSGRTGFAAAVWIVAWIVLHLRWRGKQLDPARSLKAALLLVLAGLVLTFPPFWKIF